MRELIEEFSSGKGIKAILEYDREKDIYVMTVYKGDEKIVFSGKMDEIQKQAERYFVKSLKSLKTR